MVISLAPSVNPAVSLPELKSLLRIEHDIEDALLAALLRTATEAAEAFLGTVQLQRGFEQRWTLDAASRVKLLRGPMVTLISVVVNAVVLAAPDYVLTTDAQGEKWLDVLSVGSGEATVQFVAGMATDWNGIPEAVRFGIMRHAAHLYANRDNDMAVAIPSAVLALWQPWRKVHLA
jgi:uncharacterized phiE125 gp8 family phage protein